MKNEETIQLLLLEFSYSIIPIIWQFLTRFTRSFISSIIKKVLSTYQNGWRNLKTPKAPSVLLLVMMFMATFSTRWTLAKPKTHSKSAKVDFPQARPDRSWHLVLRHCFITVMQLLCILLTTKYVLALVSYCRTYKRSSIIRNNTTF